MCYTSGTTGNPKGALYSHRSTYLHTMFVVGADVFNITCSSVLLPASPMFHVYAWGIPYATTLVGAKLVLPGAAYDGASVYELLDQEKVTMAVGVPTIWMMLLDYVKKAGKTFPYLEATGIGGAAVPLSMTETFEDDYRRAGLSRLGHDRNEPGGHHRPVQRPGRGPAQGRAAGLSGQAGPHRVRGADEDRRRGRRGSAARRRGVRRGGGQGPWIISAYYKNDDANKAQFTDDGWFLTGDVATLDAEGHMQIVDRSKDVIKSGGEWISSIDLENAAVGHPECHGGGRDRHGASQMGRTAAVDRGQGGRRRSRQG